MAKMALLFTAAAMSFGGIMATAATPAQAQVGVEIGPGGARVYQERPHYRPVIERRVERRVVVDDDEDCRIEVRRRINRYGEREIRRTRVCD